MASTETSPARREALIVAADRYEDPKLRSLRAPARDAEELARVLGDPEIGDFRVGVSLNEPDYVVRRKLSEFFRDRARDDLLLLHVSCHGLKDDDGTLYFASPNTAVEHLEATAIPSEFVNHQMTKSRSRRIVLLLDCCFGGAFARGLVHRAGETLALKEEFEGQGRVVLTASRAMEYAFEGDTREGDAQPSIFTSAIVRGLESGDADGDGDGRISVDELYDYVYDRVRDAAPNQTPSKWTFDVHGDLYVARSPIREPEPLQLPVELTAALESPFAHVRAGAVEELAGLLAGGDARLAAAAGIALEELADDDSKRVSDAAIRARAGKAAAPRPAPIAPAATTRVEEEPEPPPVAAVPREPSQRSASTASLVAIAIARAARWKDVLALAGAALLVLGYFGKASSHTPWSSDTAWFFATHVKEAIWALWSPLEAFGTALVVVSAVRASRVGRLAREGVDGLLLGVGLTVCAAMVAFVGSLELASVVVVTSIGGVAIAGAGVLGLLVQSGRDAGLPGQAVALTVLGAALSISPLFLGVASWKGSPLLDDEWHGRFYLEPLVAGVGALLALALLLGASRARLHAAGALVGIGTMLALHFTGVVIQISADNAVGDVRAGGPLGLVGGLLLVAAGASVLRTDSRA